MKKVAYVLILLQFYFAQNKSNMKDESLGSYKPHVYSKKDLVQVGHLNDFIVDHGFPFKKELTQELISYQEGKLENFVLNQGYPYKKKLNTDITNFKIIGIY